MYSDNVFRKVDEYTKKKNTTYTRDNLHYPNIYLFSLISLNYENKKFNKRPHTHKFHIHNDIADLN